MSRAASIPDERGSRELEARSWKLEAGSWKLEGCDCLDRGLRRLALRVPCASRVGRRARELALRAQTPLARFADRPAMLGIAESATPEAAATVAPFGHPGSLCNPPRSSRKPAQHPSSVIPEARAAGYPGSRKEDRPQQQQESAWFLDSGSRSLCSLGRNDGGWSHPGSPRSGLSGIQSFSHSGKRAALVRNPGKIQFTAT